MLATFRKILLVIALLSPLLVLVGLWGGRYFIHPKKLHVLLIDKMRLDEKESQKRSFFWVLNHDRYVKSTGSSYDYGDYVGFHRLDNGQYRHNSLQRLSVESVGYIASQMDAVYYKGTYQAFEQSSGHFPAWENNMTDKDYLLLKTLKQQNKLVVNEFPMFHAYKKAYLRQSFEHEFGVAWTGWVGKYYESLDTLKTDMPAWIWRSYVSRGGSWNFRKPGVVLIHQNGDVEVLESGKDLRSKPVIHTNQYGVKQLGMIKKITYPNWFEVVSTASDKMHVVSAYELPVSKSGKLKLGNKNIPTSFPAVLMSKDGLEYYFSGNFSELGVSKNASLFLGGANLNLMFDGNEANFFFCKFYYPLVSNVFARYYSGIINN